MNIAKRLVNIIKSNLNYGNQTGFENSEEINLNDYEDLYYADNNPVHSTNSQEEEYYKILELEVGADFKQIRQAYRRLLKKYHPDLFQDNEKKQQKAIKLTKKINEAYTYFERRQ